MTNIAKNQYHQIAQDIVNEDAQAQPAPISQEDPDAATDTGPINKSETLMQVEKEMRAEMPDHEGGDTWFMERTSRVIDAIGPEKFFQLPAALLKDETGLVITGEDEKIYNELSPEERMDAIGYIMGNAGQGSLAEWLAQTPR